MMAGTIQVQWLISTQQEQNSPICDVNGTLHNTQKFIYKFFMVVPKLKERISP